MPCLQVAASAHALTCCLSLRTPRVSISAFVTKKQPELTHALATQAASQDVRNLSRFASDAAAMPAAALPSDGTRLPSSSSIDSQLPDNVELQVCSVVSAATPFTVTSADSWLYIAEFGSAATRLLHVNIASGLCRSLSKRLLRLHRAEQGVW